MHVRSHAPVWGFRLFVGLVLAALVLLWFYRTDPYGGADTITRLQFILLSIVASLPAYLVLRVLSGEGRGHDAWRAAMGIMLPRPPPKGGGRLYGPGELDEWEASKTRNPVAAAVLWAARIVAGAIIYAAIVCSLGVVGSARAAPPDLPAPPAGALVHLPALQAELAAHWPAAPDRAAIAAQVEQETCTSLRSRFCWSPHAELRTPREYGFGLGQLTVTQRFNNFDAAKLLDGSLRAWAWADRFDPARQMRVLVLMDRQAMRGIGHARTPLEAFAMALAAYNGGAGGLSADRRLCAQVEGCDPGTWWGNVETHSLKARAAQAGYGQSFYAINRGYVRAVLLERRVRYAGGVL